jgi:hypothetical protein
MYNSTGASFVAGTEVTVNVTDFNDANTTDIDGGWYFFKFSSPVTLAAATSYSVAVKASGTGLVGVYGSTATNPNRYLRTTTTQAPAAGDDRIVTGE